MLEDPNVSDFLHQLALGDRDRQQVEIDAVVIDAMDCIASLWDKMTEKGLNRRTDELLQTSDEETEVEKEVASRVEEAVGELVEVHK